jgi:D-alanyl-D-alanine carboxypeptidase
MPGGAGVSLGIADGVLPSGATAFDGSLPGIARLDPALLAALRRATTDAQRRGVQIEIDSGWRSWAYQERLFDEAVATYGSEADAARWVARPGRSAHESGGAVDVGPSAAAAWLSVHGASYGLCRVYRNEPWHFERRTGAAAGGCPPMYADPTRDPRLHS